uniref:Uncharacterized protein n=1 Tax=Aureoumbra lagunensis TaxID=44058 RepID=A0A7S3NN04_9STRA|mmetsp:Transcript_9604/g.14733  ORF Transcript_9604/g.14733 Transcript_9604/m.14733 type:complete len:144 (-) Transcript_9604:280-711(-)
MHDNVLRKYPNEFVCAIYLDEGLGNDNSWSNRCIDMHSVLVNSVGGIYKSKRLMDIQSTVYMKKLFSEIEMKLENRLSKDRVVDSNKDPVVCEGIDRISVKFKNDMVFDVAKVTLALLLEDCDLLNRRDTGRKRNGLVFRPPL